MAKLTVVGVIAVVVVIVIIVSVIIANLCIYPWEAEILSSKPALKFACFPFTFRGQCIFPFQTLSLVSD